MKRARHQRGQRLAELIEQVINITDYELEPQLSKWDNKHLFSMSEALLDIAPEEAQYYLPTNLDKPEQDLMVLLGENIDVILDVITGIQLERVKVKPFGYLVTNEAGTPVDVANNLRIAHSQASSMRGKVFDACTLKEIKRSLWE